MTFVRPSLLTVCFTILLACVAPRIVPGPRVAPRIVIAQTAPQQAWTPAPLPANSQNAYSLPPDKLAKAIAISRIRNIMDIVGGLWGLAVLWLLLATRSASTLGRWATRINPHRWIQGLLRSEEQTSELQSPCNLV